MTKSNTRLKLTLFGALMFFLLLMQTGCDLLNPGRELGGDYFIEDPYASFSPDMRKFSDCSELHTYIATGHSMSRRHQRTVERWIDFLPSESFEVPLIMSSPSTSDGLDSNSLQEMGVDEGDIVKVGAHHVFVKTGDKILVTDRHSLKYLGSLDALNTNGRHKIYSTNSRFILLSSSHIVGDLGLDFGPGISEVAIYDSKQPGQMPQLISRQNFSGDITDSRIYENDLILYINFGNAENLIVPSKPLTENLFGLRAVAKITQDCSQLYKPSVRDYDQRLSKLSSISLSDGEILHEINFLGGGDFIYASQSGNIYIIKNRLNWISSNFRGLGINQRGRTVDFTRGRSNRTKFMGEDGITLPFPFLSEDEKSTVVKVKYDPSEGQFSAQGVGIVDGEIKDQWSLKEVEAKESPSHLALVTTEFGAGSENELSWNSSTNHFYLLGNDGEDSMVNLSTIKNFQLDEDIRAVRFMEHIAYVVTFRKTDPLFSIDFSQAYAPKVVGALKIEGFSTYLHPMGEDQLIGIGFATESEGNWAFFQGIQVSLFDISDETQIFRTQNHVLGERGSYSEAQSNHLAFYRDPKLGYFGLPIVELNSVSNTEGWTPASVKFSGAVIYGINHQEMNEVARISHSEWIPEECLDGLARRNNWRAARRSLDINRLVRVPEGMLSVSRFGIKRHNAKHPNLVLQSMQFPTASETATNNLCRMDAPLVPTDPNRAWFD